jgi:hypothetical protein
MHANLCIEKELLAGTCGKTQTLLKDSHLADRVDCTLDKWCLTKSSFTTGSDEKLQPDDISTDI